VMFVSFRCCCCARCAGMSLFAPPLTRARATAHAQRACLAVRHPGQLLAAAAPAAAAAAAPPTAAAAASSAAAARAACAAAAGVRQRVDGSSAGRSDVHGQRHGCVHLRRTG
jgi:hypothetical protein